MKKKQEPSPWANLDKERQKILDECILESPNPGIRKCHRCTYLNGRASCPKHKSPALCCIYLEEDRTREIEEIK